MTNNEFREWLRYHGSLHPEFQSWLSRHESPKDGEVGIDDMTPHWSRLLVHATLEDAKMCSEDMYRDDSLLPKTYSRHASRVADLARRKAAGRSQTRPNYADGQQTFKCPRCRDEGRVFVWQGVSVRAAKEGMLGKVGSVQSASVYCTCQSGEPYRWMPGPFDPKRHCPIGDKGEHHEDEQAVLVEFVGTLKPAGYNDEFEEFA